MLDAYVVYDTRSGRILSVNYGASDAHHAKRAAHTHTKVAVEHIDVVKVNAAAFARGKQYRIDPERQALEEAVTGKEGGGFGFGHTGRSK